MTVVEAKMRRATALLTDALRGAISYGTNDLKRRVRDALQLVFEAAVREATGKDEDLPEPPSRPPEPSDEADDEPEGDDAEADGEDDPANEDE